MHIREATTDDVNDIRQVAEASWDGDYPDILSRETIHEGVDEWYSPEQLRDSLAWAHTFILVAEQDETVVGFVHAISDRESTAGDLLRLYVHPDHRGEGIGRQLFEAVRDRLAANGVEQLRAMVLAENDVGISFYQSFDFELDHTEDIVIGGEHCQEQTLVLDTE